MSGVLMTALTPPMPPAESCYQWRIPPSSNPESSRMPPSMRVDAMPVCPQTAIALPSIATSSPRRGADLRSRRSIRRRASIERAQSQWVTICAQRHGCSDALMGKYQQGAGAAVGDGRVRSARRVAQRQATYPLRRASFPQSVRMGRFDLPSSRSKPLICKQRASGI